MPALVGPYSITLDLVGERVGPNYKETLASVTVRDGDAVVAELTPARRQFAAREMSTTQAGLATLHFGQVYVSIADPAPDGAVPARLYWKPLVTLIWLGGAAMALGGVLSLADRRLRFGVATRAKARRARDGATGAVDPCLRLTSRLNGAHPFSLGEKVAGEARRMRALRSEKRASRANPHPYPSPVGEGALTFTTPAQVAPASRAKVLLLLPPPSLPRPAPRWPCSRTKS